MSWIAETIIISYLSGKFRPEHPESTDDFAERHRLCRDTQRTYWSSWLPAGHLEIPRPCRLVFYKSEDCLAMRIGKGKLVGGFNPSEKY